MKGEPIMKRMRRTVGSFMTAIVLAAIAWIAMPQQALAGGAPINGEQMMSDICEGSSISCSGPTVITMDCDIKEGEMVESLPMILAEGHDLTIKNKAGDPRHTLTLSSNGCLIKADNLTIEGIDLVLSNPATYNDPALDVDGNLNFIDVNLDADLDPGSRHAFIAQYNISVVDCGTFKIRSKGTSSVLSAIGKYKDGQWQGGNIVFQKSSIDIESSGGFYALRAGGSATLANTKGRIVSGNGCIETDDSLVISNSSLELEANGNIAVDAYAKTEVHQSKLNITANTFSAFRVSDDLEIDGSEFTISSDGDGIEAKNLSIKGTKLNIETKTSSALRADGSKDMTLENVSGTIISGDFIYSEQGVLFTGCDLSIEGKAKAILCWKGQPKFSDNNWVKSPRGYKIIVVPSDGSDHFALEDAGGKIVTKMEIAKKRLTDSVCSVTVADQTYTGSALTPAPVVKWDGKTLSAGTDYTLTYKNNTNAGTAEVTITGKGNYTGSVTKTFKIIGTGSTSEQAVKAVKKGGTYTVKNLKYKVTNDDTTGKGTAAIVGTTAKKTKLKTLTVPATVKINGISFKVTEIGNNAYNKFTKLSKVTIGKNVTRIGKNAFYGNKKLKTIIIKSTKLKSVGKNAVKGIYKKAVIRAPKKKLKAYKKLFKSSTGFKKTMTIRK